MEKTENPTAQKLMIAFHRFRRLHARQNYGGNHTPGEMMLLSCIRQATEDSGVGIRVSELSSQLNVASPTITQQVNNLVQMHYVERVGDPKDRRAVLITLTDKGLAVVQNASHEFLSAVNGLVEYLGEQDSEKLAELMGKVFTYFYEEREGGAAPGS